MAGNTLDYAERLLGEGKYDEARQLLITYLKRNADSADAWWFLSQTIDDKEQQIDCLKRVLSLDPNHAPARIYLDELKTPPNTSPFTVPIDDDPEIYQSAYEKPLYEESPIESPSATLAEEDWADEKKEVVEKAPPAKPKKQAPAKKKVFNKGLLALIIILFILGILGIGYFGWIIIQGSDSNPATPLPIEILETATPVPPQSLPPTWVPTFTPIPSPTPTFSSSSSIDSDLLLNLIVE